MAGLSSVPVRTVHVAGMGVLVGGAALAWTSLRDGDAAAARSTAVGYEWLFWGAVGLVVLTGVGNLGAMAPAVPGPATRWGSTFAVKLAAVLGLLAGSLVRTLAVVRWRRLGAPNVVRLRLAYAATGWYLLGLVALAEVLAHG